MFPPSSVDANAVTLGRQHRQVCANFVSKRGRGAFSYRHLTAPLYRLPPTCPPRRKPVRHVPIIPAILVAAVLAPVAASADRMWVGFHDDPVLRFDADGRARWTSPPTNNASILRTLVTWADVAPEKPANAADPFDPAYHFDDLDEFVRNAQPRDTEVLMTLWGTPKWANGDKGRNYLPTLDERLPELRQGGRIPLLGPHCRLPVRALLRNLERVQPRPVPVAAVQLEGPDREPGGLREARCSRVRRHQGGQPQGARRDRRDIVERPEQAEGGRRATPSRRAPSPSSSRRRTRSSSSTPGHSTRIPCR